MKSLWKFLWILFPVIIIIIITIYLPIKLNDQNGFPRVEKISEEVEILKVENQKIKRDNKSLLKKIKSIQSDPDYIENLARNELGMITPNEIVYQF